MTLLESAIIHDLSNYFGSERLLYGACFAERISGGEAIEFINKIKNIQNKESNLRKFEFDLYRLRENRFDEELNKRYTEKDSSIADIKGNILLIDDVAHLGWSDAIAASLWGSEYIYNIEDDKSGSGLRISERKSKDSTYFLRSISKGDIQKEGEFTNSLKTNIREYLTEDIDIILLDLRLKRVEDENVDDPEKTSGVDILKIIRYINAAIPVIMLTASRRARNMEKVYDLGADGYFIKERWIEKDDIETVKDYYARFREIIEFAMRKAYLGSAWRVADQIIQQKAVNYINAEEAENLKKAFGLLKKKSLKFERESLCFDVGGEAVVALNSLKESRTIDRKKVATANENRKLSDLHNKSLDGGFLLGALRNFAAHSSGESLDEDDYKIALYLTFRLFMDNDTILTSFVEKSVGNEAKNYEEIIRNSYSRLANLTGMSYSKALKINPREYHESLYPDSKRKKETYPYNILSACNKKIYHYLLFLCRLKSNPLFMKSYVDHSSSDNIIVTHIYNKIMREITSCVGISFEGTVSDYKTVSGIGTIDSFIEGNNEKVGFSINDIGDVNLRCGIKKGDKVYYELTVDAYCNYIAINISPVTNP